MSTWELDREQKTALVRDGFVVLPNVVPMEWVNHAKRLIEEAMPTSERRILAPAELATHPDVIRLFRDSPINEIILAEMGPYPDVVSCQIAITPGGDQLGGKPFPHVDGGWSGPIPTRPEEIEPSRGRPVNPVRYFGENDETRGTNDGLLWQDPDRRISMGSYTALVGIALNNQLVPGNGQFGVLKGMQEEVEAAFGDQRDQGSVIGPEGVGWPTNSGR